MYEYIIKAAAAVFLEELMLKSWIVEKIFQIGSSSLFSSKWWERCVIVEKFFEIWKIFQKSSKFGRFLKNLRNFEDIWKILLNLGEMLRRSDCCCEN